MRESREGGAKVSPLQSTQGRGEGNQRANIEGTKEGASATKKWDKSEKKMGEAERAVPSSSAQGCQMAKFDPFLSLDCAINQILQFSTAEP